VQQRRDAGVRLHARPDDGDPADIGVMGDAAGLEVVDDGLQGLGGADVAVLGCGVELGLFDPRSTGRFVEAVDGIDPDLCDGIRVRRGNLFYASASDQTVIALAKILKHIGAVRAMQFDINPEWHTLITYTHDHGLVPKLVEPQPQQLADRYLVPDDRDFFAVYRRLPGPVTVPFR